MQEESKLRYDTVEFSHILPSRNKAAVLPKTCTNPDGSV